MADDLVALALKDPDRAERRAREVIRDDKVGAARATAHQALGIVHRDRDHLDVALPELRPPSVGRASTTTRC